MCSRNDFERTLFKCCIRFFKCYINEKKLIFVSSNKIITRKCFKDDTSKFYNFNTIIRKNESWKFSNNRFYLSRIINSSVLKKNWIFFLRNMIDLHKKISANNAKQKLRFIIVIKVKRDVQWRRLILSHLKTIISNKRRRKI